MTTAIKRRRGTTAQHATFTGLEGELTVDTTKDTVVVHDGATAGGFPLAKESQATSNVAITGGSITGITDLAIADGGTGASTAANARTNLGVTATGSDTTYAYRANNLSDLASASTARSNLGLGSMATQSAGTVAITGGTITGVSVSSSSVTSTGLTSGRVTYAGTSGLLQDSANMTFNGTTLTLANDASISGLTVGKGGGAQSRNTAIGVNALSTNSTGNYSVAVGNQASQYQTGSLNTVVGDQAMLGVSGSSTGGWNTAIGQSSLNALTTGNYNVALGQQALVANTSGSNNTALGSQTLVFNTTASNNTAVGYQAGYSGTTAQYNTFVGMQAGYGITTGARNTFVGNWNSGSVGSGSAITTGSANTILGAYNGNAGGLDIRTASNYIVLSDGDGNPRGIFNNSGQFIVGSASFSFSNTTTGASFKGSQTGGGSPIVEIGNTDTTSSSDGSPALICFKGSATTSSSARFIQFSANGTSQPMGAIVGNGATNVQFASISDAREKTNVKEIVGSLNKIALLKPVEFDWIIDGTHVKAGFIAQDVKEIFPEFVVDNMSEEGQEQRYGLTGGMTGGIISHLVKAIQELKAEVDSLKQQLGK